jgi:isochorismate synthase EntC
MSLEEVCPLELLVAALDFTLILVLRAVVHLMTSIRGVISAESDCMCWLKELWPTSGARRA